MRKVKIVNDGFLETLDGHMIECPKKFKQCHTTCAWFGNLKDIGVDNDTAGHNLCVCHNNIIGALAT